MDFSSLEDRLGYKIKNTQLLVQAFTHASYLSVVGSETFWERDAKKADCTDSYQRLQYMGEGVAEYFVCKYLFAKYPQADPCMLHKLKICCMNNQLFCVVAVDLGLDAYLRSSSPKLIAELEKYKACLCSLRTSISSLDGTIDLDDLDHCFVKVLSDLLEALMGVVMYDTGNYDEVERVFLPIFEPYFNVYATPKTFKEHPKCFLYEMVAKERGALRNIRWIKRERPDRKGFYVTRYRGYLGEVLLAEEDFKFDNCIAEKRFFKRMYENVAATIKEFHKSTARAD